MTETLRFHNARVGYCQIVQSEGKAYLYLSDGRTFEIDLGGIAGMKSKVQMVNFFDDFIQALPPKSFSVGDIIETQEEADRLPGFAVIVNHDEGYVPMVYQVGPNPKYDNYFLTPGEYGSESASDIDLPATIVWLPETDKENES